MSDALPLPPRPDLQQYKKLAKDLKHACESSEPGAIRDWALRWVETLTRLEGRTITTDVRQDIEREATRIDQRWRKLNKAAPGTLCKLADAQFFVAREHGFLSWPRFASHIAALSRTSSPVSKFEAAVDAIVRGDVATLGQLLRDRPDLARDRSTREHRSTLLHYVSANGVEDFRQKTPGNIVDIATLLIDAGADVNAESVAYGGGSTTLGLVATSIHPEQAGVQIALLQTLLDRGARLDQPSAAGNGHSVVNGCIANGQPAAAEFLASRGAPLDLESGAALGRLDVVKRYLGAHGAPTSPTTKDDVASAFLYACGYGHEEIVTFLLECGIKPNAENVQAGLHWAAYSSSVGIVKLLLDRGWPVHVKQPPIDATPLEVALHVWARSTGPSDRDRASQIVTLLVRAGATIDEASLEQDHERRQTLDKLRSDPRMQAALRGE